MEPWLEGYKAPAESTNTQNRVQTKPLTRAQQLALHPELYDVNTDWKKNKIPEAGLGMPLDQLSMEAIMAGATGLIGKGAMKLLPKTTPKISPANPLFGQPGYKPTVINPSTTGALPEYMEPFLKSKTKNATKGEKFLESGLSAWEKMEKEVARTTFYDKSGNVVPPYKNGGKVKTESWLDKY